MRYFILILLGLVCVANSGCSSVMTKATQPLERAFGFTLLGTQTCQTMRRFPDGYSHYLDAANQIPYPVEVSSGETYVKKPENPFVFASRQPLSTFGVDVDTAAYANVRRMLDDGMMPPPEAVRIEEMLNYFDYQYPAPAENAAQPFAVYSESAPCPWNPEHRLVRIGIKGKEIKPTEHPPLNLVFLLDVSGSMNDPDKLPLVKEGLKMLTGQLTEKDRVSIIVYAGSSGVVLAPTTGNKKEKILDALEKLSAGGSTAGGEGIALAYKLAKNHFNPLGQNRIILCTDGDFNVGVTDSDELIAMVKEKATGGVYLNTLGFGTGNTNDHLMEQLADNGNGSYAYIDSEMEARKVLVQQMTGSMVTIAKDVKIQVDFNPGRVGAYRLIGYENRVMANEDFKNDKQDSGEIGAGHQVTALYEIISPAMAEAAMTAQASKYVQNEAPAEIVDSEELLTLRIRHKEPDGDTSTEVQYPVRDIEISFTETDNSFQFAAAVAQFGLLLSHSDYKSHASYDNVLKLARAAKGDDPNGYRLEFIQLVKKAKALAAQRLGVGAR